MLYKATISSFPVRHLSKVFSTGAKLINTDYILDMKLYGSDDARIDYQLRSRFDRDTKFQFIVTDTLAQVVAGSNVSANSAIMALPVFEGDDTTSAAVTHYFNVEDVAWAENATTTTSYVYVQEGADLKTYIVDYNIDQIMDIATSGTTTTTTTTTTTA